IGYDADADSIETADNEFGFSQALIGSDGRPVKSLPGILLDSVTLLVSQRQAELSPAVPQVRCIEVTDCRLPPGQFGRSAARRIKPAEHELGLRLIAKSLRPFHFHSLLIHLNYDGKCERARDTDEPPLSRS